MLQDIAHYRLSFLKMTELNLKQQLTGLNFSYQ